MLKKKELIEVTLKAIASQSRDTSEKNCLYNFLKKKTFSTKNIIDVASDIEITNQPNAAIFLYKNYIKACKKNISHTEILEISNSLHNLGHYQEAENLFREVLGENLSKIDITKKKIFSEKELFERWGTFEPKITFICISYNHERYINYTMMGFLCQNCEYPFEIIVHDDASTDATQDKIRYWQNNYPNIIKTVLRTENIWTKGRRPLDEMYLLAKGKYIAICEGDDYWINEEKIQKQVCFLEKNNDFVCSGHGFYAISELSGKLSTHDFEGKTKILSKDKLSNVTSLLHIHSLVFKKVFNSFPKEKVNVKTGDIYITSMLGLYGKGIIFGDFLGSVARRNPHSTWTTLEKEKKLIEFINTRYWLSMLHKKHGNYTVYMDFVKSGITKYIEEVDNLDEIEKHIKKIKILRKDTELKVLLNCKIGLFEILKEIGIALEKANYYSMAINIYEAAVFLKPKSEFVNSRLLVLNAHGNIKKQINQVIDFDEIICDMFDKLEIKISPKIFFEIIEKHLFNIKFYSQSKIIKEMKDFINFPHKKLKLNKKVFIIGKNKTGTTSLNLMFKKLGFVVGNQRQGELLVWDIENKNYSSLFELCETAQVFQDIPFSLPGIYEILYSKYPDAYYILLERDNEDVWYQSLIKYHKKLLMKQLGTDELTPENLAKFEYVKKGYLLEMQRIHYGLTGDNIYNEKKCKDSYLEHIKSAKKFFRCKENFLALNLNDDSASVKLADFLNFPRDAIKIPHTNKS